MVSKVRLWTSTYGHTCVRWLAMSKCSSGPRRIKTGQLRCWIKYLWLTNKSLKTFSSIEEFKCSEELVKEMLRPPLTAALKNRGGSLMVRMAWANYRVKDLNQMKGKLNQTDYHSILHQKYAKSKEERQVLQLMSWSVQTADLNPMEMNLTDKSELNKPQVQLNSINSCRKADENYL